MNAEKTTQTKIELCGINHFSINVTNMDKSLAFYNGILGFPIIQSSETRGGLKHVEVDAGNVAIALFESPQLDLAKAQKVMTDEGYLHYAFGASKKNFETIMEELKKHQVRFDGEVRHDSVYFFDPDGHQIEIHFVDEN